MGSLVCDTQRNDLNASSMMKRGMEMDQGRRKEYVSERWGKGERERVSAGERVCVIYFY